MILQQEEKEKSFSSRAANFFRRKTISEKTADSRVNTKILSTSIDEFDNESKNEMVAQPGVATKKIMDITTTHSNSTSLLRKNSLIQQKDEAKITTSGKQAPFPKKREDTCLIM